MKVRHLLSKYKMRHEQMTVLGAPSEKCIFHSPGWHHMGCPMLGIQQCMLRLTTPQFQKVLHVVFL